MTLRSSILWLKSKKGFYKVKKRNIKEQAKQRASNKQEMSTSRWKKNIDLGNLIVITKFPLLRNRIFHRGRENIGATVTDPSETIIEVYYCKGTTGRAFLDSNLFTMKEGFSFGFLNFC